MKNKNEKYIVYMHVFPNNKKYIGITKRKASDRWTNGHGYKKQIIMNNAIQKYGWKNIQHIILSEDLTREDACEMEKKLINLYKTTNRTFGYNCSTGGEKSAIGYRHTEEAKYRIKINNAKYWKGKHRGSEFMREIAKGNKNRAGKIQTEKAKQLNREKHNKKINQYDLEGNFIKHWAGIKEAEIYYNLPAGSISKVCKNKRKTTGGYVWKYDDGGIV